MTIKPGTLVMFKRGEPSFHDFINIENYRGKVGEVIAITDGDESMIDIWWPQLNKEDIGWLTYRFVILYTPQPVNEKVK